MQKNSRYSQIVARRRANTRSVRSAYTLIELTVAIFASSFLLAGLGSSIYIATQIVNPSTRTQHILDGTQTVQQIADEIRFANYIIDRSPTMIEFVTNDRTGDDQPDRIRYEWSGTAGDPLTKVLNDSAPQDVIPEIDHFDLSFNIETTDEEFESPAVQSSEQLLDKYTGTTLVSSYKVTTQDWIGQYIPLAEFSDQPLPGDTLHWSVTKIRVRARYTNSGGDGVGSVKLTTATGDNKPSSTVLDETEFLESSLSASFTIEEMVFDGDVEIGPNQDVCITIEHKANSSPAHIQYDEHDDNWRLATNDAGATWTHPPYQDALRYELYGTYTQPSYTTETISHQRMDSVSIELQIGDNKTLISTETNLYNRPELTSAHWSAGFNNDPTAIDWNFDGSGDWKMRDNSAFDVTTLVGGVWQAYSGELDTTPANDFSKPTLINVRMRNTSVGGKGAVCWINADWNGSEAAPIYAALKLQSDGTQTLSVFSKEDNSTANEVATVTGLTDGFIDVRIAVLPNEDIFAVWHDDQFIGSFNYVPFVTGNSDRFVSLLEDGSEAEFAGVRVKVLE